MASLEYEDLYYIATDPEGLNDAYSKLMMKERRVLDAVNSVVQQKERVGADRGGAGPIFDEPLAKIMRDTADALMGMWRDLQDGKELKTVFRASRRLYLGLASAMGAILLLLLNKSDGR